MIIDDIKETFLDYPDDESLAVIVFFRGCRWNCPNCQNKALQNYEGEGISITEAYNLITSKCKRAGTNKIVFSGGDPFYKPTEIIALINILEDYDICVYTGYTIEEIERIYKEYERKNRVRVNKPLWFKCGTYNEEKRDKRSGKSEKSFILATTNQAFYRWDKDHYSQISKGNILEF